MARNEIDVYYWVISNHSDYKDQIIKELMYEGREYIVQAQPHMVNVYTIPEEGYSKIAIYDKIIHNEEIEKNRIIREQNEEDYRRNITPFPSSEELSSTNCRADIDKHVSESKEYEKKEIPKEIPFTTLNAKEAQKVISEFSLSIKETYEEYTMSK